MRELHVVALSSDGRHLVLGTQPGTLKGAYLLKVTPKLREALDPKHGEPAADADAGATKAGRRRAGSSRSGPATSAATPEQPDRPASSAEIKLPPREIQARLRAGQSPERVARAAGVPVERVTRYYGPVQSERALIVAAAREATLTRARRGPSAASLEDSVAANLVARGAAVPGDEAWDAYRRADGSWIVHLDLVVRGRAKRAEWIWQPATRSLAPTEPYAAALGHVVTTPPKRRRAAPRRPAG